MSARSNNEERDWAADKREFVADRRDDIAAERDAVAQAREATADAREVALDGWERRLAARAGELGVPSELGAAQLAEADAARDQARRDRVQTAGGREAAVADREQATKRRLADNPSQRLATATVSSEEPSSPITPRSGRRVGAAMAPAVRSL